MILRKPYAFLIKNFKKINLILLALTIFILWKQLDLYSFVKDYIQTGVYNTMLDSISNYVNIFTYLSIGLVLIISMILAYLLKYKDKPYISYIIILITNLLTLALSIYTKYYFTITITKEFDLASALIVRDLNFILTIPYYPIIFLLVIRSIGLDLKSFGFGEDKDFINIDEEDREEVEVEVSFNKDKFIRQVKNKIRLTKYFFLEHKFSISVVAGLVLLFSLYNVYTYVFVENKVYKPNETFVSEGYSISINNTYLTNRDYTGNLIDEKMYYVVVESTITNNSTISRTFNPSRLYLYVDSSYYLPSDRFNTYFVDMGTLYRKDKSIKAGETQKLLFVYEIKKPQSDSNFLLTYQNVRVQENTKRIRIKVVDISKFITKARSNLNEKLEVPLNLDKKWQFTISNYQITNSINYRYQECNKAGTCPIYEGNLTNKDNKTILYLKYDFDEDTKTNFLAFMKKYGKVRYTINGITKEQKIKYQISNYRGNHAYIEVSNEVMNASNVELCFTVRSYQYFYKLKGE